LELLGRLSDGGYRFMPPTPAVHRRILWRRPGSRAESLEDIFGWNRPFGAQAVDRELVALMHAGRMVARRGPSLVSTLRVASLEGHLYLHSGYGDRSSDAVFFGPDTYRFAAFIRTALPRLGPKALIVDIGAGSGAGGIFAHAMIPDAELILSDVNPLALRLAAVNAAAAGVQAQFRLARGAADAPLADLILANPPFVAGLRLPTYSRGGGRLGEGLSLDWAREGASRLAPGGVLLLYTGSPIFAGHDLLRVPLTRIAESAGCALAYEELDPDILPELLLQPAYWRAERIAAVGAIITRPA